MQTDDGAELLGQAAKGNTDAFLKLFEAHYQAIYRFAYRLTNAAEIAEDVTQECFVQLIREPRFDQKRGPLRQYLYGIARNLVLQRRRVTGREVNWDDTTEGNWEAGVGPANAATSLDVGAAVQAALSALPPLQREAIILCEFEELSLADAAAVLGTDLGTLKGRIHRAREGLRRRLAPYRGYVGLPTTRGGAE
jgi:RNA polymerase sigma-70 factor, ECF subfamily